jgi:hypothetical protein
MQLTRRLPAKPDHLTMDAVELYNLMMRVVVLIDMYEPQSIASALDWFDASGAEPKTRAAMSALVKAACEENGL